MDVDEGKAMKMRAEIEEVLVDWHPPPRKFFSYHCTKLTGAVYMYTEIPPPTPEALKQQERERGILAVPNVPPAPSPNEDGVRIVTQDRNTVVVYPPADLAGVAVGGANVGDLLANLGNLGDLLAPPVAPIPAPAPQSYGYQAPSAAYGQAPDPYRYDYQNNPPRAAWGGGSGGSGNRYDYDERPAYDRNSSSNSGTPYRYESRNQGDSGGYRSRGSSTHRGRGRR